MFSHIPMRASRMSSYSRRYYSSQPSQPSQPSQQNPLNQKTQSTLPVYFANVKPHDLTTLDGVLAAMEPLNRAQLAKSSYVRNLDGRKNQLIKSIEHAQWWTFMSSSSGVIAGLAGTLESLFPFSYAAGWIAFSLGTGYAAVVMKRKKVEMLEKEIQVSLLEIAYDPSKY